MPFTIFSHNNNTEDVRSLLTDLGGKMTGTEEDWKAEFQFKAGLFKKNKLVFSYDREWCSPPNWPIQLNGMANFVGNFQMENETREKVMSLIRILKCGIAIVTDPEIEDRDDPRLELMHQAVTRMDGFFFTPGSLLDAGYLPLASADGEFDAAAKFPDFPRGFSDG